MPEKIPIQLLTEEENHPSGYPFTDGEVEWKFVRLWLLKQTKKIIPGGYEHLSGEVNDLLKGLTHPQADRVRYSCMGEFTRLDNTATRTGTMLGYVLSHQVIPDPMIDPTALYFKIGKRVMRFSREEYALVSGLKFGPADFNPYTTHKIPPNSTFSRLFGENPNIRLVDLKNACTSKTFKVNGEAVKATTDDIVKFCKLLLCLGFALGVDGCKKKIPTWMWVLLESEEEWENFPWGSYSYQVLLDTIKGITSKPKKEGTLNITLKGNTVAFSAWIFEAIPAFGEIIGLKKDERQIPRFMQYSYTTSKGWPSDKKIKKSVVRMLKPHSDEKVQPFWKSLEADEAPNPFAFKYDPTDSMKKKGKMEDEGDEEEGEGGSGTGIISTAMIDAAAEAAVTKSQTAMKAMLEECQQKSIEPMLAGWHKNLLDDVVEKVAKYLLDKAGGENTYSYVGDITTTLDTVDHLADTLNTVPSTPLEPVRKHTTVVSTPAKTTVLAVEESTKIPAGAVASPGNPSFSLGVNFDSSQPEELVQLSQNYTFLAAAAAPHPATSRPVGQGTTEMAPAAAAVGGMAAAVGGMAQLAAAMAAAATPTAAMAASGATPAAMTSAAEAAPMASAAMEAPQSTPLAAPPEPTTESKMTTPTDRGEVKKN